MREDWGRGRVENEHSTDVNSMTEPGKSIHPDGESCFHLGLSCRVLVLNAPAAGRWHTAQSRRTGMLTSGRRSGASGGQGLTLVHVSARTQPFLSLKITETTQRTPQEVLRSSRNVDECPARVELRIWRVGAPGGGTAPARASSGRTPGRGPLVHLSAQPETCMY